MSVSVCLRNLNRHAIRIPHCVSPHIQPCRRTVRRLYGRLFCSSTTELCSVDQRRTVQERGLCRRQMLLLSGSSMSLSRFIYSCPHRCINRSYCQVPYILPQPFSHIIQQDKLLDPHLRVSISRNLVGPAKSDYSFACNDNIISSGKSMSLYLGHRHISAPSSLRPSQVPSLLKLDIDKTMLCLNIRGFSSVSSEDTDSDPEFEYDEIGEVNPSVDPKEVDRVCKVINELFVLDRNMEAVLDGSAINLTHDLVVEVLQRFCHARRPAFRFFCWAGRRPLYTHNSRTYNMVMDILGRSRQFETMVSMLEEMGGKGLLTMETFSIAIRAFASAKERKKALGVFELMKKHNFTAGVDTVNCLLDALGRAKLGKEAQALFEKLKDKFTPDLRTYSILLYGWCKVNNLIEAGRVWNEMIDNGFKPDVTAHNTMIEGLLKGKKRSDAVKLFEVMKAKGPSPSVRTYTILIRNLCKQIKMKEAVDYFEEMLGYECQPDAAVYTCLITGFGNQRKMDKVYWLLKEMKEKGCPPDGRTYNALIKLLTNRRMPDDAVSVYKKMIQSGIQPTFHTYNMMMKSYFRANNYEMGRAVWEEMGRKGCCPDDNSYIVLIGGLIRHGRCEEACKYIEEMMEKGMKAPQLDYNKFAADFSKAGKPDILEELARKMKFLGKFEASNVFARWAEMTNKRLKRRDFGVN